MKSKLFVLVIWFVVLASLSPSFAWAQIYDDFSGNNIDLIRWDLSTSELPTGTNTIFSQSDGFLHADMGTTTGNYGYLTSTVSITGDFDLVLKFSGFQFNGVYIGDVPGLSLFVVAQPGTIGITSERFWNDTGHNFSSLGPGLTSPQTVPATSESGLLRISRIGADIYTYYNEGSGWLDGAYFVDSFLDDLFFGLEVYSGDSGLFHVDVDYVKLSHTAPVPEPATMILLGAGLLSIAGMRLRKKTKV
jgi:hypothetical protein